MSGGRAPAPTAIKKALGITRKARIAQDEPEVPVGMPDQPYLSNPRVVDAWYRFGTILLNMGVLTPADGTALQRLCECHVDVETLTEILSKHPKPTYESDMKINLATGRPQPGTGTVRPRPERAMLAEADKRLRQYLSDFGLSPSARTRVKVENAKNSNDPKTKYF